MATPGRKPPGAHERSRAFRAERRDRRCSHPSVALLRRTPEAGEIDSFRNSFNGNIGYVQSYLENIQDSTHSLANYH
jgi:hypothetical protein